ncbi:calponin homology domain-containing protein DDB_G0272472 isoform X2 [Periplaneta americana]|uniref:calponin homology domain-containing protein DDB_G0272472 isoform X2 n=1 Tax=Periplaneta americana TaxID=6978 RepID=UPI0037E95B2E
MSRPEKSGTKIQSVKSYNFQASESQCVRKDKERSALQLTGSQVHLTNRPRLGSGKASSRTGITTGIHSRRPLSAIPSLRRQDNLENTVSADGRWKRPLSADSPYFSGGRFSASSSATSECDEVSRSDVQKQYDTIQRKNKLAAKFPLLLDSDCLTEIKSNDEKEEIDNKELDHGFGATYILPTSQLLESLTCKPLGRTWTESELKECCEELGIKDCFYDKCERESLSSDCSNGACHSEKSLGEQIIAMAQDPRPAQVPCILPLEPGVTRKPPLPKYKKNENSYQERDANCKENYINCAVSNDDMSLGDLTYDVIDRSHCLKCSAHFVDQCKHSSEESRENGNHICNSEIVLSSSFPNTKEMLKKELIKNALQCLNFEDEVLDSAQNLPSGNSQAFPKEGKENGVGSCSIVPELNNYSLTENRPFLRTSDLTDNVSHDLTDTEVHRWFPLACECEVTHSHLSDAERETDLLLMNLARQKCNFDCSGMCQNFNVNLGCHDDMDLRPTKQRKQELCLENLLEENADHNSDPSTIRIAEGGISYSLPNRDYHAVNKVKQTLSHSEINLTFKSQNCSSQESRPETCTQLIADTEVQGNDDTCNVIANCDEESKNSNKPAEMHMDATPSRDIPASAHSTHSEVPENDTLFDGCSEPLNSGIALQPPSEIVFPSSFSQFHAPSTCQNMEQDVYDKITTTFEPEQRSISPVHATSHFNLNIPTFEAAEDSTYDDIVTILKVLEQEDTNSLFKLVESKFIPEVETSCSNTNLLENTQKEAVTSGKLSDILTYLDEVERSCDDTLRSAKNQLQAVSETTQKSEMKLATVPRLEELLNLSTVDLAHEVLTLRLQLEEKSNSIRLLQETLNQHRELSMRNAKNADRGMKMRLREQKEEYESTVARHQKFIDQLIADKKTLSDKCESLVLEMKKSAEHHAKTLKTMEERHSIELQRAREMHAAAEKLRRERWIDNKTQKIKEMTVKGLEPELQRMNTRHEQELADLRLLHKQELEELEARAVRKTAQQMDQLRDQMNAEKEEALAKEKELLRKRYDKQAEQEEVEYQAQRRKFLAEIRREKERLAEEETRMREELEEAKQNMCKENAKIIERLKVEHQEAVETCERKHKNEVKSMKETAEIEKETWMHNYKKEQAKLLSERELEIKDQFKRERDKEIELVIEKLESEATKTRTEMEQTMDSRLRRLKEKFDAEIKDMEESEKALKNKYNDIKGILVEKEDEVINLKANARQLDKELEEAKKIVDRLSGERIDMKEIIRKEFQEQLSTAEEENIKLREEMAELRAKHKLELASKVEEMGRVTADREMQLQQVYNRVKLAIAKKEDTIQKLKLQHKSALERCCHLEELLDQQRRDFLLK